MAPLFNGPSDKQIAGPGISKGGKKKNIVFNYFELLMRKFWKLVFLNIIFIMFMLPYAVASLLIVNLLITRVDTIILVLLALCPFAFIGPFIAGLTKITRDFVREEPVYLWGDFISTVKKNYKQTLLISIMDYIAFISLVFALMFYGKNYESNIMFSIALYICIAIAIIYLFSHYYIYVMAITLKLNFKQLVKNSVLFSFMSLISNLVITVISTVLIVFTGLFLILATRESTVFIFAAVFAFLVLFILFSLLSFTTNYIVFPTIKKFAIDPYYKQNPEETARSIKETRALKNIGEEIIDKELPEYVYENGRMIHRSVIENVEQYKED